ncbi:HEAT repeat domain-containing protein [Rhizobium halophytocola]|uniref:Novel STAND NTPase 3 domain-containing protein n=1 Tax=Rhizobium halophytocola TaxID=735519 RepID=A0ABS4E0Q1_9HYPH|nr:HEAT repeat domain-containing protein [Rhizobium halophytocola]MBP1851522.1 hypothetical protein [Rhizobium halophytocola]
MADKKTAKPKSGKSRRPRKRRTTTGGGIPARSRGRSGNPGYAGYEYQIEVTVWVALDLLLAKAATEEVVVEPSSDEDLEAAVREPSTASLGLTAEGESLNLILQAKTRSGSPWSTAAIADVLLGKDADQTDKGRKRIRPLEMLQAASQRRYVFVTNEASAEGLRPHEGEHLFDFPEADELPPYSRGGYDATAQAALAPRILLLTGVTREVLATRISALLSRHGHVPASKHADCLSDLRDVVRQRIQGANEGRWKRSELLDVLVRHGGSVAPTRDMDHYVRPSSFDAIKERLDTSHAAVIVGPSGTGKTLTADILELDLRRGTPPFDIVGEEYGPGHVRHHLTRSDPVLFHLRDPWGGNRLTPGADRWSGELPKLLDSAGPGRKFLITSRSDVLQSAGIEMMKDLQSYVVSIKVEDYGPKRLGEIYDGIAADLTGHARGLAGQHRDRALAELTRPYEIKRFLVALSRENGEKPRKIDAILADSQVEAISKVIAAQIASFGVDGAESSAVIWAMLNTRGAVARDVFAKLGRRLRDADPVLRPDIEGLIDFLVAGQNLRQDGAALSFHHPRVEDGLRLIFMRRARDAERTLSTVVDVLVGWDNGNEDWGLETGLGILRAAARIEDLNLDLSDATQERLDAHLEAVALSAHKRTDFERALRDLERFGSPDHVPSRLARILLEGGPKTEAPVFRERWHAPQVSDEEVATLRSDGRTKTLIDRFVREVLPFSYREYCPELIALLGKIGTELDDAFWDALNSVAVPGGPHENIDVIVTGALSGDTPDYDRAIARFARSEAEADTWLEGFAEDTYRAQEHAVDADAADHIIDEPGDQYFNARQGMKVIVKVRRARDGIDWIVDSPHCKLLVHALAELISESPRSPQLSELAFLLEHAEDWGRDQAWHAAQQHWDNGLSEFLLAELTRSDLKSASHRQRLVEIAAVNGGTGDPVPDLLMVFGGASAERRLEIVYDLIATKLNDDPEGKNAFATRRAWVDRLVQNLGEAERGLANGLVDILTGEDIRAAASALPEPARDLATSILHTCSIDLAGPLACLAAAAGLDIKAAAERLLRTDDAGDGREAIQALHIANGVDLRTCLRKAMAHKRYVVRREALRALVPDATPDERKHLILVASDDSADMRLAFAHLMEEHRWPEAIDPLIELLADTRNFGSHLPMGGAWSRFSVPRAAARALGAFEGLPVSAIDALLDAASAHSADPFVACAALSALAKQDDARITPVLLTALESPGLDDDAAYRPRAQAAAWALCTRATSEKLDALDGDAARVAQRDTSVIAGPLLVAFGALGGELREKLLRELRAAKQSERETLVRMTAIAVDRVGGLSLDDREQIVWRLARGESLDGLNPNERAAVENWSQALNLDSGFERFIAWVANAAFGLPLSGEIDGIRAFDLPKRIGVMTMRSMSPYREEEAGIDDGM